MKAVERFADSNVLLYLVSADERKAALAEQLLEEGATISVQVLDEFASVASRRFHMTMAEVRDILEVVRQACTVVPLTEETHDVGLRLAERYKVPVHDAMILASAVLSECREVLSEDMHDGLRIEGSVRIRNPFRQA